jgi:hypothetical protein
MTTLHAIEQLLWRSVRHDRSPPEVGPELSDAGRLRGGEGLSIYRRMYWYRQIDALWDSFPALGHALGEERFTKLACAYIAAHPSEHPALEWLGRELPRFVRERGEPPSIADIAELEWAQCRSLLAPDPPRVATAAEVRPEAFASAILSFVPSVAVCRARLCALTAVGVARRHPGAPVVLADDAEPVTILVHRPRFATTERALEIDEAEALAAAQRGEPLAAACAAFAAHERPVARAAAILKRWFDDGLIAGVQHERSS